MITVVTTCMGRREHLEASLPLMLEEFERVIVVDWSCPQDSGKWAQNAGADVIWKNGEAYFNASKARNLGACGADSPVICFLDCDSLVMPGLRADIESSIDSRSMVVAARGPSGADVHSLGGFLAVSRDNFGAVGGYNEALEGYGPEDYYLRAQLCLERGLAVKRVSRLSAMRHSDGLRGEHHRESIAASAARNSALLMAYLASHGIQNWSDDARTKEIAYRL